MTVGFATAGTAFTSGPAEACATARVGTPGSKVVTDSGQACGDVTIVLS